MSRREQQTEYDDEFTEDEFRDRDSGWLFLCFLIGIVAWIVILGFIAIAVSSLETNP